MSRPVGDKLYAGELLESVLATPMPAGNDASADTIGEYLGALLEEVWRTGEEFDSKRPFGNSDWHQDLYLLLVQEGLVGGVIHRNPTTGKPYATEVDKKTGHKLITAAIRYAFLGECKE